MKLKAYLDNLSTPEKIEALRTETHRLGEQIAELAATIGGYDVVLRPVWDAEKAIKAEILDTHCDRAYAVSTRDERKAPFERLLQLSLDWGRVRGERKDADRLMRAYQREADKIATEIKFLQKRKARQNGKKQG